MASWLQSPPGRYVQHWEQDRLDQAVADAFGFHALQLGLPAVEALRANRMPCRWIASDSSVTNEFPVQAAGEPLGPGGSSAPVSLHCEFDALPFPAQSIDLVVLPHTLELARDAHLTLREVDRVLRPEGRLVLTGFNPASLWGLRQVAGRLRRGRGAGADWSSSLYMPRAGDFIGYWRLRDWLRLLGYEIELGRFGCYLPPLKTERWLQRWSWLDPIGDRWWPVFGAAYMMVAVKRVRGMRLVGLLPRTARAPSSAVAAVNRDGMAARWSAGGRPPADPPRIESEMG